MRTELAFDPACLIGAMHPETRARLVALSQSLSLRAGETSNVMEAGQSVFFVVAGEVRVSSLLEGRIAFQDLAAGDEFGLLYALGGHDAPSASLLALSDAEILVSPACTALDCIGASAGAAMALARMLARSLESRLSGLDPLRLVYRDLLRAAKPSGDNGWTIDPIPRHRELAQRAGVAEEEAASAIANLVRLGVARRRYPALDIADRETLRRLSI